MERGWAFSFHWRGTEECLAIKPKRWHDCDRRDKLEEFIPIQQLQSEMWHIILKIEKLYGAMQQNQSIFAGHTSHGIERCNPGHVFSTALSLKKAGSSIFSWEQCKQGDQDLYHFNSQSHLHSPVRFIWIENWQNRSRIWEMAIRDFDQKFKNSRSGLRKIKMRWNGSSEIREAKKNCEKEKLLSRINKILIES